MYEASARIVKLYAMKKKLVFQSHKLKVFVAKLVMMHPLFKNILAHIIIFTFSYMYIICALYCFD